MDEDDLFDVEEAQPEAPVEELEDDLLEPAVDAEPVEPVDVADDGADLAAQDLAQDLAQDDELAGDAPPVAGQAPVEVDELAEPVAMNAGLTNPEDQLSAADKARPFTASEQQLFDDIVQDDEQDTAIADSKNQEGIFDRNDNRPEILAARNGLNSAYADPAKDPRAAGHRAQLSILDELHRTGQMEEMRKATPAERKALMRNVVGDMTASEMEARGIAGKKGAAAQFANYRRYLDRYASGVLSLPELSPDRDPLSDASRTKVSSDGAVNREAMVNQIESLGLTEKYKNGDAATRAKITRAAISQVVGSSGRGRDGETNRNLATRLNADALLLDQHPKLRVQTAAEKAAEATALATGKAVQDALDAEANLTPEERARLVRLRANSNTADDTSLVGDFVWPVSGGVVRGGAAIGKLGVSALEYFTPDKTTLDDYLRGGVQRLDEFDKYADQRTKDLLTPDTREAKQNVANGFKGSTGDGLVAMWNNPRAILPMLGDSASYLAGGLGGAKIGTAIIGETLVAARVGSAGGLGLQVGAQSGSDAGQEFLALPQADRENWALYKEITQARIARDGVADPKQVSEDVARVLRASTAVTTGSVAALTGYFGLGIDGMIVNGVRRTAGSSSRLAAAGEYGLGVGLGAAGEFAQEGLESLAGSTVKAGARTQNPFDNFGRQLEEAQYAAEIGAVIGGAAKVGTTDPSGMFRTPPAKPTPTDEPGLFNSYPENPTPAGPSTTAIDGLFDPPSPTPTGPTPSTPTPSTPTPSTPASTAINPQQVEQLEPRQYPDTLEELLDEEEALEAEAARGKQVSDEDDANIASALSTIDPLAGEPEAETPADPLADAPTTEAVADPLVEQPVAEEEPEETLFPEGLGSVRARANAATEAADVYAIADELGLSISGRLANKAGDALAARLERIDARLAADGTEPDLLNPDAAWTDREREDVAALEKEVLDSSRLELLTKAAGLERQRAESREAASLKQKGQPYVLAKLYDKGQEAIAREYADIRTLNTADEVNSRASKYGIQLTRKAYVQQYGPARVELSDLLSLNRAGADNAAEVAAASEKLRSLAQEELVRALGLKMLGIEEARTLKAKAAEAASELERVVAKAAQAAPAGALTLSPADATTLVAARKSTRSAVEAILNEGATPEQQAAVKASLDYAESADERRVIPNTKSSVMIDPPLRRNVEKVGLVAIADEINKASEALGYPITIADTGPAGHVNAASELFGVAYERTIGWRKAANSDTAILRAMESLVKERNVASKAIVSVTGKPTLAVSENNAAKTDAFLADETNPAHVRNFVYNWRVAAQLSRSNNDNPLYKSITKLTGTGEVVLYRERRGPQLASHINMAGMIATYQNEIAASYPNLNIRIIPLATLGPNTAGITGNRREFKALFVRDARGRPVIFMVADRHADAADVVTSIRHEIEGHWLVETLFGARGMAQLLGSVAAGTRADPALKGLLRQIQADYPAAEGYSSTDHMREVVARIAANEAMPAPAQLQGLEIVRRILSQSGLSRRMDMAEVRALIQREVTPFARASTAERNVTGSLWVAEQEGTRTQKEAIDTRSVTAATWRDALDYNEPIYRAIDFVSRTKGQTWEGLARAVRYRSGAIGEAQAITRENFARPVEEAIDAYATQFNLSTDAAFYELSEYATAVHASEVNSELWERKVALPPAFDVQRTQVINDVLAGRLAGAAGRLQVQQIVAAGLVGVNPNTYMARSEARYAGITDAEAATIIGRYAGPKDAALQAINNGPMNALRARSASQYVEAGTYSQNVLDYKGYQHYVPRRGLGVDRAGAPLYEEYSAYANPQTATRGRQDLPLDQRMPRHGIEQLLDDTYDASEEVVNRDMMRSMADFIRQNPEFGTVTDVAPGLVDANGNWDFHGSESRFNTRTYYVSSGSGPRRQININDASIRGVFAREPNKASEFGKAAGVVTRVYSRLQTSWSPDFLPVQLVRDVMSNAIYTSFTQIGGVRPGARLTAQFLTSLNRQLVELGTHRTLFNMATGTAAQRLALANQLQADLAAGRISADRAPMVRNMIEYQRASGFLTFSQNFDAANLDKRITPNSSRVDQAVDQLARGAQPVYRQTLGRIETVSEYFDGLQRFSLYDALRQSGVGQDAALIAVRRTQDFAQRGPIATVMNRYYSFAAASLASQSYLVDVALWREGRPPTQFVSERDADGRLVQKQVLADDWMQQLNTPALASLVAVGFLGTQLTMMVMGRAAGEDRDEADKKGQSVFMKNVVVPTAGGSVSLGMQFGLQQLTMGLGAAMASVSRGYSTPGEAGRDYVNLVMENMSPGIRVQIPGDGDPSAIRVMVNQIAPTVLQPFYQLASGLNGFGSTVVRGDDPIRDTGNATGPSASAFYQAMATATGMRGEALENFVSNMGGVARLMNRGLREATPGLAQDSAVMSAIKIAGFPRIDQSEKSDGSRTYSKVVANHYERPLAALEAAKRADLREGGPVTKPKPFQKRVAGERETAVLEAYPHLSTYSKVNGALILDRAAINKQLIQAQAKGDFDGARALMLRKRDLVNEAVEKLVEAVPGAKR